MSAQPSATKMNRVVLRRPGGGEVVFNLTSGSTLADLLLAAQASMDSQQIMIDGRTVEESMVLQPGMIVTATPRVPSATAEGSWRDSIGFFRDDATFLEVVDAVEESEESREAEKDRS